MSAKRKGLGRGLDVLINEKPAGNGEETQGKRQPESEHEIPIDSIERNPYQPRSDFDPETLKELVESIRTSGVLQPLLVRRKQKGYELIAGERRLLAATEAGLKKIPARIMDISDEEALELALVENLQREDLNPIEEAKGYKSLMDRFDLNQQEVAERVGKARASVANALRLLQLEESVRNLLAEGKLNSGHAKVLAGFEIGEEQRLLAKEAVKKGLSVRQMEKEAAKRKKPHRRARSFKPDIPETQLKDITEQIQRQFGTAVNIQPSKTLANGRRVKGRIEIDYYDSDELDRLLVILGIQDIV